MFCKIRLTYFCSLPVHVLCIYLYNAKYTQYIWIQRFPIFVHFLPLQFTWLIGFSYFLFDIFLPHHTWLSSKRAVTMCWTQKPGGTSVACAEATTLPAKLWQGPSTSSAMVRGFFYHTVISTAPGEMLVCGHRHSHHTNDLNLLLMQLAGYNEVVRIPSGATNIDVRQHSYSGKPEDDNYLGKTPRKFQFPLILFLMQCVVESI